MSLISDTDFLIHSLRLSYLRDVDDPYAARIITLDPQTYNSNPYILTASLADTERWPELAMPISPNVSEDESENPTGSGFPGANLKHTRTIMGGRTGGLGMRVHGKRASTSKRMTITPRQADVQNFISENAPLGNPGPTTRSLAKPREHGLAQVIDADEADSHTVQVQEPTLPVEAPVQKVVQFIPKFKGASEMEAKRRIRMAARRGAAAPPPPPVAIDSSSEDEPIPLAEDSSSSSDSDFGDGGGESDMGDGDEFDPDFVNSRNTPGGLSDDDLSAIGSSLQSGSSAPQKPMNPAEAVARARRSPPSNRRNEKYFPPRKLSSGTAASKPHHLTPSAPPASPNGTEMTFSRKRVAPIKPQKSALSAMLASSTTASNPFSENYAAVSGRGEAQSVDVLVFFPHARQPANKGLTLNVRKEATVEEVLGFALWTYWEEGWLPKLDEGLSGEDDPMWDTQISAVSWIVQVAEEDGEVDDDFPAPDRLGKVAKLQLDAYAILAANASQIAQNKILESKINRKPSRTAASKRPTVDKTTSNLALPNALAGPSTMFGSTSASVPLSSSLGPSFSHGPQIFLRIKMADPAADAVHISTTIEVSAGMYMQEALEQVCKKQKISNPKDYVLLLDDRSIIIPLDRTVASLQGKRELVLCKRSMLSQVGGLKSLLKTTDPNASIFKRMSEPPEAKISSGLDFSASYKRYTIYRKMAMLVARQERTLAIDGVYIHIMPSNKAKAAVFDNGKTFSYHIKNIAECMQSTRSSSTFKLVLNRTGRSGANKRYDLEAESPKLASEIVQTIRSAMPERSGTINKSRRSRHVG